MIKGEYEIFEGDKSIYKGKNTLTNNGKRLIGKMLYDDIKITNLIISATSLGDNRYGVVPPSDALSFEISNSYSVIDSESEKLYVNFEAFITTPLASINLIGLTAIIGGIEYLVTASNPQGVSISGLSNVYASYKLTLDI